MDRDWARLGDAVRHARKSAGLKQDELADAVNVSRATIQAIERGDSFKKVTHTHRAIAAYFEWDPGSIETTLAGGEPKPAEPSPDAALRPSAVWPPFRRTCRFASRQRSATARSWMPPSSPCPRRTVMRT